MFSAAARMPTTGAAGLSWARAFTAARTAMPPHLSYFIHSMPRGCFREIPPASKVMVLPMSTTGAPGRVPGTFKVMSREPRRLPRPTARMAWHRLRSNSFSPQTVQRSPCSRAMALAAAATRAGVASFPGRLARSRTSAKEVAITLASRTAFRNGLSLPSASVKTREGAYPRPPARLPFGGRNS
jgi:hypothetical protein